MNRRDFLKKGLVFTGIGISIPAVSLITSCERTETAPIGDDYIELNLSDYPGLTNIGGAIRKDFENANSGYPIIIIRKTEFEFLAFSSRCSHQGCIVNLPTKDGSTLECFCHGAKFSSIDGSVVGGPNDGQSINPLTSFHTDFDYYKEVLKILLK